MKKIDKEHYFFSIFKIEKSGFPLCKIENVSQRNKGT